MHVTTQRTIPGASPGVGTESGARGPLNWKRLKALRHGVFLSNRYETIEEEDARTRSMRGESQEETMHTDIMAAVEAEMDSILADFGTEHLTKIMLITTQAAVPAIVSAPEDKKIL